MAITKCENSHFYDDSKFDKCPHCAVEGMSKVNVSEIKIDLGTIDTKTEMRVSQNIFADSISNNQIAQASKPSNSNDEVTVAKNSVIPKSQNTDDERTVALFRKTHGYDPVVGWIVCVHGNEKGRDYRLHSGRNFVGRAHNMDICLADDVTISRENHCSFVYDPSNAKYHIVSGDGTTVFINGVLVDGTTELRNDDIVKIGASAFVFVSFCTTSRKW